MDNAHVFYYPASRDDDNNNNNIIGSVQCDNNVVDMDWTYSRQCMEHFIHLIDSIG